MKEHLKTTNFTAEKIAQFRKKHNIETFVVLRFLVGDKPDKAQKVSELLDTTDCIVPIEVIAEAVYNMYNYYGHTRDIIAEKIKDFIFIKEDLVEKEYVVRFGCKVYVSTSLDFVDCILLAYANVNGNMIFIITVEV